MRSEHLILGALLLSALGAESEVAQATLCTPKESVRVEAAVPQIKDWPHVYKAFRDNRSCNGESVVEAWSAYSEVIATLLADHWDDVGELSRLVSAHPAFKAFIIKHLEDETIPENVLSTIRQHAAHECRSGLESLCKELEASTK